MLRSDTSSRQSRGTGRTELTQQLEETDRDRAAVASSRQRVKDQPAIFLLEENWRCQEGLAQHMQTRAFQAMDAAMADLLAEHYTVEVTEMISPSAT